MRIRSMWRHPNTLSIHKSPFGLTEKGVKMPNTNLPQQPADNSNQDQPISQQPMGYNNQQPMGYNNQQPQYMSAPPAAPYAYPQGQQLYQPVAQPPASINIVNTNSNVNENNLDAFGPKKSRMVALLLAIFLGMLGAHRFYVGKWGTGLIWLFTLGILGVGWIVDIVRIVIGSFRDKYGRMLV